MKNGINVMLVEDNPAYRKSITYALNGRDGITLTHQFGTAEIAIQSLLEMVPAEIPDVILLDLNLPGMSGLDALPDFRQSTPQTQVIILTQSNREADIMKAISLGASGYLLKSSAVNELREGIQSVMRGGASLDEHVAKLLLEKLAPSRPKDSEHQILTEREIEMLTLLATGLVKKEIAERLSISTHTVNNHIRHIYEKLQVPNAPAAIAKAYKSGILSTDK
jgi:two-component system nitrate/nitrite response regulator NarL